MLKKLTSRKLWCAVISSAMAIAALFFAPEVVENIEHLLVALSPILAYILGQSAVDCASNKKETISAQNNATQNNADTPCGFMGEGWKD